MKADGSVDSEALAKAGVSPCGTDGCSAFVLPGVDTCSNGHTQVEKSAKEDTVSDTTTVEKLLAKAEADLATVTAELDELKKAAATPAEPEVDAATALAKAEAEMDPIVREAIAELRKSADDAATAAAEAVAKADIEREHRVVAESIAKAEELGGIPADTTEFAAVLRACGELLPGEVNTKLEEILRGASEVAKASGLLAEVGGNTGRAATAFEAIERAAMEIQKSETNLTREAAIAKAYDLHPELVAAYKKES